MEHELYVFCLSNRKLIRLAIQTIDPKIAQGRDRIIGDWDERIQFEQKDSILRRWKNVSQ